jgi:hypothetical protein
MKDSAIPIVTVANDALGLQNTTKASLDDAAEQKMHARNMITSDW